MRTAAHNRADILLRQASVQPDKLALIFEDRTWTYADLLRDVQSRAAGLTAAGISQGQKIGLMLETDDEIVSVADHNHVPMRHFLAPLLGPQIEDVVQVHVGQQR